MKDKLKLISAKDLAEYLGVSPALITKMKKLRELPTGYVLSKRVYYDKQEVIDWVKTRTDKA